MKKIFKFLKRLKRFLSSLLKRFLDLFRTEGEEKRWILKGKHFSIDKQKHVVAGLIIFVTLSSFLGTDLGGAITVTIAVAKEVADQFGITNKIFKTGKTAASFPDFLATVLIPIIIQLINLYLI